MDIPISLLVEYFKKLEIDTEKLYNFKINKAKNDNDIKIQAENYIKQLKEDNLILFNSIYPDHKAKFEVRIYDN